MSPVGDIIRVHLTREDYMAMPDDGKRYELVSGEMFMTPAPIPAHQFTVVELVARLSHHAERHGLGCVLTAPIDVVLAENTVVQPDVIFIARDRERIITATCIEGAPDLVVEILSPGTAKRDLGVKLDAYAKAGVRHYWTVDLVAEVLLERELAEGAYKVTAEVRAGATFRPRLFPDLAIEIGRLFRKR